MRMKKNNDQEKNSHHNTKAAKKTETLHLGVDSIMPVQIVGVYQNRCRGEGEMEMRWYRLDRGYDPILFSR